MSEYDLVWRVTDALVREFERQATWDDEYSVGGGCTDAFSMRLQGCFCIVNLAHAAIRAALMAAPPDGD